MHENDDQNGKDYLGSRQTTNISPAKPRPTIISLSWWHRTVPCSCEARQKRKVSIQPRASTWI